MNEFYAIKRGSLYLARKTRTSFADSCGLYWASNIKSARRYAEPDAAFMMAHRINGSMRIVKVRNFKEVN